MAKIINTADAYVTEMLDGLLAWDKRLARDDRAVFLRAPNRADKVGIASGGGSGHFPLFVGYTAPGLIDACAVGDVFAGPSVDSCMRAIKAADQGQGVLLLYGNYGGDRMNFDLASEMLEMEGIRCKTLLGTDDIASGTPDEADKRRGVAGLVLLYKIAGAMADQGLDLDQVHAVTAAAADNCRTIGVALSSCTLPGRDGPSFDLAGGEIEMGMGIHGEPGIWRDTLKTADALAGEMVERLLADPVPQPTNRVALMLNTLGATPVEELLIMYRRISTLLAERGLTIAVPMIGPFTSSMDMGGMSLTLMYLDSAREAALQAPSDCRYWTL
jgi:phosphoenolpyruvate---glycerone phosphotransferase subunit DhaK